MWLRATEVVSQGVVTISKHIQFLDKSTTITCAGKTCFKLLGYNMVKFKR